MENKPPKFVRWAVLVGIVVLVNLFTMLAVSYAYPEPQYNDFCENRNVGTIENEEQCTLNDGKWNAYQGIKEGDLTGYCDLNYECSMAYEDAREGHAQLAYLIVLAVGALAIVVGMFLKGSSIVAAGLSYGGVVLLIVGSARYLSELDQSIQVLATGVALILVLAVAYKKFKD